MGFTHTAAGQWWNPNWNHGYATPVPVTGQDVQRALEGSRQEPPLGRAESGWH